MGCNYNSAHVYVAVAVWIHNRKKKSFYCQTFYPMNSAEIIPCHSKSHRNYRSIHTHFIVSPIHPFFQPAVQPSHCLSIHLSIHPSDHLAIYPFVCPFILPPIHLVKLTVSGKLLPICWFIWAETFLEVRLHWVAHIVLWQWSFKNLQN